MVTEKTFHNYSWGKHINDCTGCYGGGWERIEREIKHIKEDKITYTTMERINKQAGYAYIVVNTNCDLGIYSVLFTVE